MIDTGIVLWKHNDNENIRTKKEKVISDQSRIKAESWYFS